MKNTEKQHRKQVNNDITSGDITTPGIKMSPAIKDTLYGYQPTELSPSLQIHCTCNTQFINWLASASTPDTNAAYTKLEAFTDLVNRQQLAAFNNDCSHLDGGILALARAWKWSRIAVKKYAEELQQHHVARLLSNGTKYIIVLTCIDGLPPLPKASHNFSRVNFTLYYNNLRQAVSNMLI